MKKYALSMMFLLISGLVYADVWVVTAPDKSVYSISSQNDAVVPAGYTVEVLKGSIEDLALTRPVDEYQFTGKKFKVDAAKVKAKEDKQLEADTKINEKKAKRKSAIDKLKALGLLDDEITALWN